MPSWDEPTLPTQPTDPQVVPTLRVRPEPTVRVHPRPTDSWNEPTLPAGPQPQATSQDEPTLRADPQLLAQWMTQDAPVRLPPGPRSPAQPPLVSAPLAQAYPPPVQGPPFFTYPPAGPLTPPVPPGPTVPPPPPAGPGAPGAAPGTPHHSHILRWALGTTAVAVVVALAAGLLIFVPRLGWTMSQYGYAIVAQKTVSATDPWSFQLPWNTTATSYGTYKPTGVIDIYSDPQLTQPVPFVSTDDVPGGFGTDIRFTPSKVTVANQVTNTLSSLGGTNWPAGTYYIVERRNLLGQTLDHPRVHVYTVQPGANAPTAPQFTMGVTSDGVPQFQWPAVDNATSYDILKLTPTSTGSQTTTIIGTADGNATSWLASAQDMGYENQRQNGADVSYYNSNFRAYTAAGTLCLPQDDDYQGTTPPAWDTSALVFPSFAVVALDSTGNTSLPVFQDGKSLVSASPLAWADQTKQKLTAGNDSSFIPNPFPVTMGDCRLALQPVTPTAWVTTADQSSTSLAYSVGGSLLTDTVTAKARTAGYSALASTAQQASLYQIFQYGPMEDLQPMTAAQLKASIGQTPSTTAPDSPYTWNGSSEMVTYIAANMFAGSTAIDLSRFTADPSNPLIYDAANEAWLQNPYITDLEPIIGIQNDILYVNYEMSADQRAAEAARIKAKADSIVQTIITPGMSDRDKALSINNYLAKNAVYDTAAANFAMGQHTRDDYVKQFPDSWDAAGVLINGKGVCSSYAAAYKVLADDVGLTTVTVTGYADDSGVGHEWIKAKLDGKWRVIDPTWDSNIWEQIRGNTQTFFSLTDAQADRTQFDAFVVDSLIPQYAAQ